MADNSWLQILINLPPEQPCNIVWRRSCPNAKAAKEGGMDLSSPVGTPVYSLGTGQVIGAGYFWFDPGAGGGPAGGVVTVRTTMPDGSINDIFYQHIQISGNIQLCNQQGGQLYNGIVGPKPTYQNIQKNQLLGWTFNLDGPHVEVGMNATGWYGIWGDEPHPGPWYDDPEPLVRVLMNAGGGLGSTLKTGNSNFDAMIGTAYANGLQAVQRLSQVPGLEGPLVVLDNAMQFRPFAIPPDPGAKNSTFNPSIPFLPNWVGAATQIESGASYPVRVAIGVFNFIGGNFFAFIIRGILTIMILVVIFALLINLTSHTVQEEPGGNLLPLGAEAVI